MTRRKRWLSSLAAALVASAVFTAPAAALAETWTITPGGPFDGVALGEPVVTIQETGMELSCAGADVSGTAKSGSGLTNPLASLPAPGFLFRDCHAPLGFAFTWVFGGSELVCHSYDGAGVSLCRLAGLVIDMYGPGCTARITGDLDVSYTNGSGRLRVLPGAPLVFDHIDPAADCLGHYQQGQHLEVAVEFQIVPDLTITSP